MGNLFPGRKSKIIYRKRIFSQNSYILKRKVEFLGGGKHTIDLAALLSSFSKFCSDMVDFVHNSGWHLNSLQEVLLLAAQAQTPAVFPFPPKIFRRKRIQNWVVWNYFWPELKSPLALNMPFISVLELCSRRWGRAQAQCHVSEQNTQFTSHSHSLYLIACEYLTGNGTGYSVFNAFRN